MRRKHGIPDSDCRPFAVAYPAAKHARAEREAQERKKTTNHVSNHLSPALDQRTNVLIDAHGLRRRVAETTVQLYEHHLLPGRRPVVNSPNSADRYNPNARYREVIETVQEPPSIARKDIYINDDATEESRKRSFVDESDVEFETMKKSRIDGDEQADWYAQYTETRPRRESKGSYDLRVESNYVYMNGQERPSHINDLRDEDHEPADEAMGDADEDEVTELRTVPRGKKRDRIEAGSTFGGDDEEDAENSKSTHHRKRRTISRRKSEITTRGKKRDREAESPQSEGEGDGSESSRSHVGRTSRKKRGKKATSDGGSNSLVDPRVSKEPLCGGRRIGEEWEAEGVQYKVGDKGERLRLALLKKARNKYPMPKDSQHPDRSAALEIYVETWMTEEQYREAEERQKLAWQEAPRTSDASKTPDILESPTKSGKDLLWDSVKGSPARRPFRQSMTASPATRINPFQQSQSQPALGRRVASSSVVVSPVLSGIAGSPTRPGFRGFSKWEKQDREAEALAKIRAKMEEQKKAQTPLPEPSGMPTSVTAPELGGKTLTVPTITFTPAPPPSTQARSDKGPAATESKPATSAFSFATPSTTDSTKPTAVPASTATPSFSLPSAAVPTAPPSTPFPSTPTAVPTTQTIIPSTPSLPFAKLPPAPSATASTATATPSTSSIPNFFAKPAIATTPATTMPAPPSPFTLGATTQAQPPSTIATPKPSPFSFARPSTAPSTLTASAVVPAPSTAKSQLSIFGAASNTGASSSAPTPVAPTSVFGSTPAAIKAETPAFTTATPSDSSKPAAPLFSFSGASSTTPASTTPSAPRFSFGQPSTTSAFAPASTSTTSATSQPKPTSFKFGQISTAPTDGVSTSTPVAADESKKSIVPVSVFGATATLKDEVAKPSPFGGASSAFGGSAFAASSSTNIFGKPASAGGNASTSIPSTIPTFSSMGVGLGLSPLRVPSPRLYLVVVQMCLVALEMLPSRRPSLEALRSVHPPRRRRSCLERRMMWVSSHLLLQVVHRRSLRPPSCSVLHQPLAVQHLDSHRHLRRTVTRPSQYSGSPRMRHPVPLGSAQVVRQISPSASQQARIRSRSSKAREEECNLGSRNIGPRIR
ncbi:hypothetical protein BS17DRAFT_502327 [Gyrodon lividus]|nr:hypothetical protein BS17DRAFT_502327 [Gyrodon lividus]